MNDLISRQEAIIKVKELFEMGDCYCDKYSIVGLLNGFPPAEPQWIPVSERMPETTDEVLTTYIVNGNKKRRFVQTATWYDNDKEGNWYSPWDEYLAPNTKIEVLAWMPLPKPYKGERE